MTASELDVVRRHLEWQASSGASGGDCPLVSGDGSLTAPGALSAAFKSMAKALGLSRAATFHTLRHTHASWCLAEGVDLVTLSERLGHADPSTTARIYGHVIAGRDASAASAFESLTERLGGRKVT